MSLLTRIPLSRRIPSKSKRPAMSDEQEKAQRKLKAVRKWAEENAKGHAKHTWQGQVKTHILAILEKE